MKHLRIRFGVLALLPLALILSGCGWEPLRPTPEGPRPEGPTPENPSVLTVEIEYDCEDCVASQQYNSQSGVAPLHANFNAKVNIPQNSDETVILYGWDFGDGTSADGERVAHTFENPGTYRVNLRIITSAGNEARDELLVIANPNTLPPPDVQRDREDGLLCSFERILPSVIYEDEPFKVQVVITTHQAVQVVQWEDNIWFREFKLKQEPIGVWIMVGADHRISLEYEAVMLSEPTVDNVWMEGVAKCNAGGYGESEVLDIRSHLTVVTSEDS